MNRKIYAILICTILTCNYVNAQDLGAQEDGNVQPTLNASELSGETASFTVLYQGSSGDGFDAHSNQVLLLNSNFKIYDGSSGDGFSQKIAALTISGNNIDNLYGGNLGDGFSRNQFQSFLNGQELSMLYRGNFGDGADSEFLSSVFLEGFINAIFEGGNGDGFASLLSSNNYLSGLMLTLYHGGNGDGFAVNNFTTSPTLDLIEKLIKMDALIYPNPANHIVHIKVENSIPIKSIQLFDVSGKEINNIKLSNQNTINVSNLSDGIYLLNIHSDNGSITKRIMVKK